MFKSLTVYADVLIGLDMYGRPYELSLGSATTVHDDQTKTTERVLYVKALEILHEVEEEPHR